MKTTTAAAERLIGILANGAMRATARIIHETPAGMRSAVETLDGLPDKADALSKALRLETRERLDQLLIEWREVVDAGMGEPMLRAMLNAQANEIAIAAVRRAAAIAQA